MTNSTLNTTSNFIGCSSFGSFASVGEAGMKMKPTKPLIFLAVEVGEHCQLDCRHCIYHRKQSARVSDGAPREEVSEKIAKYLMDTNALPEWLSFAGKEPTVYPDHLVRLASVATKRCGLTILMTNGLLLRRIVLEKCERVVGLFDISLDGDESAHDWMRGAGMFARTMSNIQEILSRGNVPVGIIATAVRTTLDDGRRQIESIITLAHQLQERYGDHPNLSLSISLYYDRPGHPFLLQEDNLAELAEGLGKTGMRSRILWTANYAHLWPAVSRRLGLNDALVRHDKETAIPFVWDKNLCHVLFNLTQTPLLGVRISRAGDVYLGCNHLTLGEGAAEHRVGNILEEDLGEIITSLTLGNHPLVEQVNTVHSGCATCPDFETCRGGDPLSGIYFGRGAKDPYCRLIA